MRHFLGEGSPIVVVASKCLGPRRRRLEPLNVSELKRAHRLTGQIRVVDNFDVTSVGGIAKLQLQIEEALRGIAGLLHAVSPLQRRIKNRSEKEFAQQDGRGRRRALIPRRNFAEWCQDAEFLEKRDVALGKRGFPYRSDPDTLLRLAHDFGSLFFFGTTSSEIEEVKRGEGTTGVFKAPTSQRRWLRSRKDAVLRDWLIHPHWLKRPLYHITRESESNRYQGGLTDAEIDKVLNDHPAKEFEVPDAGRDLVMAVLNLTELCHYSELDGKYLFPRGLPASDERCYPDWYDETQRPGCELSWFFLPEAAFHRLVVRWFAKIHRRRLWRFGMWVKEGEVDALVRSIPGQGKVTVDVHGGSPETQGDLYRDIRRDLVDVIGCEPESELRAPRKPAVIVTPTRSDVFSWLHLTDLHFGLRGQASRWPTLRGKFLESLKSVHEKSGPWNAIFFTGDLVQAGRPEEFARMQEEVLDPLWEELSRLGSGDAVLLAAPGNHDLVRPDLSTGNPAISSLLESARFAEIQDKFWDQPDGAYRQVINAAFRNYEDWWAAAPRRAPNLKAGLLPGEFSTTLTSGSRRIGVMGLNTTFLQLSGGNYEGNTRSSWKWRV